VSQQGQYQGQYVQPQRQGSGAAALIGNVLWVFFGLFMALGYVWSGILMCLTIIGIPFAVPCFKLAGLALWPFGKAIVQTGGGVSRGCLNILWTVLCGIWLALGHAVVGVLLCITIIGIPFGVVSFRLARLALWPFGRTVMPARFAPADAEVFAR
jgi:uncharacterized membrane protein YccF (DUF307 family)